MLFDLKLRILCQRTGKREVPRDRYSWWTEGNERLWMWYSTPFIRQVHSHSIILSVVAMDGWRVMEFSAEIRRSFGVPAELQLKTPTSL